MPKLTKAAGPRNHHRQATNSPQTQRVRNPQALVEVQQTNHDHSQQPPQESRAIKIEAPNPSGSTLSSQAPKAAPTGTVPQLSTTPGTAYPAQRTSTLDVNGNPVYPPQGKPLLQVDMDADLAEEQKIWRRPGEDQSDYFNYGFDEFTWETYRQRQISMAGTLQQQKDSIAQMQQMMGGGMPGMPSMPVPGPGPVAAPGGAPSGPGGGGGMAEQQQMEMMFQQMVSSGMDPSQMDFGSFMQMAGGGMGGGFPAGPGGQHGGFQHGIQGGGGWGGRGRGRGW
jgi:pre-mRNA 3'-end-processing factor FIP1